MSWAAHDFETYVLQKHLGIKVSFLAIVAGTYFPDAFTKWWVYGVSQGPFEFGASEPAKFHRGWPGAGFTHSILFVAAVATAFYLVTKSKAWGWGIFAGGMAHIVTDTSDTLGTLLFWPFFNQNISTGLWAYAAEAGRYDDVAAYYSSLGFVMDVFWLIVALAYFSVFREKYFWSVVVPADQRVWNRIRSIAPDRVVVAVYRAGMFYGMTRLFFWTMWTHVYRGASSIYDGWDLSPGGPDWIPSISL